MGFSHSRFYSNKTTNNDLNNLVIVNFPSELNSKLLLPIDSEDIGSFISATTYRSGDTDKSQILKGPSLSGAEQITRIKQVFIYELIRNLPLRG